jgi:peptidoglycan/LPS O-acetylase OafA/YrhL
MRLVGAWKAMREMTSPVNRLIGLDLIRVFAIYYVFVQHGNVLVPDEFQEMYALLFNLPIEGVSVFFLLSGFLIGSILCKQINDADLTYPKLLLFWKKRILRIVPSYFIVLILMLVIGIQTDSFDWTYFLFSQNLFEDQAVFFKVSWSLSVEMWFYLLFPLSLFILLKLVKNPIRALLISISIFIFCSFSARMLNFLLPEILDLHSVRNVVLFRMDSMMYGALAAMVYVFYPSQWSKYAKKSAIVGILCVIVMLLISTQTTEIIESHVLNSNAFSIEKFYHEVTIYYVEALPMLFLLPFCTQIGSFRWSYLNRIVVFISRISYAVYLTHACLVLWFIIPVLEKIPIFSNHPLKNVMLYTLYVILSFAFSLVLYFAVEKPFTSMRKKFTEQ